MRTEIWAYIAGFFEADGGISICGMKNNRGNPCFISRLAVYNTNPTIPKALQLLLGGSCYPTKTPLGRPSWTWSLCGKKAAKVAKQLFPYTSLKRKQLEVFLDFIDLQTQLFHRTRIEQRKYSRDEIERLRGFAERMRELNKGGGKSSQLK